MRIILFIVLFIGAEPLVAKVLHYGSERENISVSYGVTTILRFDEEVKTISQASAFKIEPANSESPDYRVLAIKPLRKKAVRNVSFILANEAVVSARISVVHSKLHETTNAFYDLKAKSNILSKKDKSTKGSNVTEVELMKAMIRADKIVGYKTISLNQKVNTGTKGIKAKLIRVYSGPNYHGYIFKVSNESKDKSFALDVKSLTLGRPNVALLTQADANILDPNDGKRSTLLRIVAKPSSVYYNVTLPVALINK